MICPDVNDMTGLRCLLVEVRNIFHRNSDIVSILAMFRLLGIGCRVRNIVFSSRAGKCFWTLSTLEREDWVTPAQIWQQHSIFFWSEFCKDRAWNMSSTVFSLRIRNRIFSQHLYTGEELITLRARNLFMRANIPRYWGELRGIQCQLLDSEK